MKRKNVNAGVCIGGGRLNKKIELYLLFIGCIWVKATFLVHCPFRYVFELILVITKKSGSGIKNF